MYWQQDYLRVGQTMVRGTPLILDLPKTGLLSSLVIELSAAAFSGYGATGGNYRLIDQISSVQVIVNGSTIVKSLTGKEAYFLGFLHNRVTPFHQWRNYATNTQYEDISLAFGTSFKDTQFGLDLSKYDSAQLIIYNTATAATHSADIGVTVWMNLLRDAPAGFRGVIRSEQFRTWTTVQNAYQYLTLPSEFPICTLAVRAFPAVTNGVTNTSPHSLMDNINLSIGGGTKQLFNGDLGDLALNNLYDFGADVIESAQIYPSANSAGFDMGIMKMNGWSSSWGDKAGAVATVDNTMIADATDGTPQFYGLQADKVDLVMGRGAGLMHSAYLLFVPDLNTDLMVDPKRDGEIRLNIHTRDLAAAAGGTNEVYMERVVMG
jgi:hypothetical protein